MSVLSYFRQLDMNLDIPEKRDSQLSNCPHVAMSVEMFSSMLIDTGGPSLLSVCPGGGYHSWADQPEL